MDEGHGSRGCCEIEVLDGGLNRQTRKAAAHNMRCREQGVEAELPFHGKQEKGEQAASGKHEKVNYPSEDAEFKIGSAGRCCRPAQIVARADQLKQRCGNYG